MEDSNRLSAASQPTYGKRGTSLTGGSPGGAPAQSVCARLHRRHLPVAFGGAGGDSKGYSVRAAHIAVRERPYL